MEIDKYYEGREHSAVKHELLKGYLEKLLFIVGVSGVKEIAYVDCFATPWGDESENLAGTSIAISLDKIKLVREGLAANNKIYDLKFRAIYVEENKNRHARLENFLNENSTLGHSCRATSRIDAPESNRSNTVCWLFHQYWRRGDKQAGNREQVPWRFGQ